MTRHHTGLPPADLPIWIAAAPATADSFELDASASPAPDLQTRLRVEPIDALVIDRPSFLAQLQVDHAGAVAAMAVRERHNAVSQARCARRSESRPVRRSESRPPAGGSFYVVLT